MHRSETQFCRDQAERLLALAKESADLRIRDHLAVMANDWLQRAKEKERPLNELPRSA
jgi:hypothetical protein